MGLYLGETSLGGGSGGGGIDGGVAFPVTVVSGGGAAPGSGSYHGGGGAGGYLTQVCQFHIGKTYDIVVGAGGGTGSKGNTSSVETAVGYLALPGGGNGGNNTTGGTGTCDGGSGNSTSTARAAQSPCQVFAINSPLPRASRPSSTIITSGTNISAAHEAAYCERYGASGGNGMGASAPRNAYGGYSVGGAGIISNVISTTFATANSIGQVENGEVVFCGGGSANGTDQTYTGGGGAGSGDANSGGGGSRTSGSTGGSGVVFIQAKEDTDITTTGTVVTETANGIKTYCFKTSGTITFN